MADDKIQSQTCGTCRGIGQVEKTVLKTYKEDGVTRHETGRESGPCGECGGTGKV